MLQDTKRGPPVGRSLGGFGRVGRDHSFVPQPGQNRLFSETSRPQVGQVLGVGLAVPQVPQKLASARTGLPQAGQVQPEAALGLGAEAGVLSWPDTR